ncbi:SLOG family protein [Anaerotignum sp. MB30-C6]|uniref:SLOG family protein n=1 Tax=Anaerotignum sp. MB30-C6 TaxID=3070814 RepID=UPI0027DE4134|nr:SLOG family protein [Anaerotignum sp. MB30-C6]WMI82235.1 SLOG family protein [Anaerotignum sp. MB30-C6]
MEKSRTCCFTGDHRLPKDRIEQIVIRLNKEVDNLISQGVTDFISGGALGFDMIAASLIISKKEMGNNVRLIFVLPCREQDKLWSVDEKKLYQSLLGEADEIIYVSKEYYDGCMRKRNQYMVDRSAYCICASIYPTGGTAQTVRFARQKCIRVFEIAR